MFWKKWRHRSPENVVEQLKILAKQYDVKIVWFADENFAADREVAKRVLELIVEADLGLSLNLNMTAADVVRDADLIPLYKRAGVDYIVMGIETLKDEVVTNIRKNNPYEISREAVPTLRENHIVSLTNIIYGLEEESWGTIFEKFKGLLELDSDILNAMYLTPHFWTAQGKATQPYDVIQIDQDKWSYRNQVLATALSSAHWVVSGSQINRGFIPPSTESLEALAHPGKINGISRSCATRCGLESKLCWQRYLSFSLKQNFHRREDEGFTRKFHESSN